MAGKVADQTNEMFNTLGAVQTLVENFPMSLFSFGKLKFGSSFDVLAILFKLLGIDREELIDMITNMLCGDSKDGNSSGFISQVENLIKTALEANIMGIMNCSTNPIISNSLLDKYVESDVEKSGIGITLNVSEIDFTGVLNKNPFHGNDSKFYFDVDAYNASNVYNSKDFNAYLWYIVNKSDRTQDDELIWKDRLSKKNDSKELIRCTYIDENFPNCDKIKVQICGSRNKTAKNYFGTRKILGKNNIGLNKTIFEFNHDFLNSIKFYDPKVILAEIIEYFLGTGNFSANIGFSVNEEIIQGKIEQIIKKVIEANDLEVNDCFFSFSNEEYNEMLEKSEKNRFNVIKGNDGYYEVDPNELLNQLTGITSNSTLNEDKSVITKTITDVVATPAKDPSSEVSYNVDYDWQFELMRMLVYPFVRPLFTPKVMFVLLINKKIMGAFDENVLSDVNKILDDLMNSLFSIIKDIITKIKDLIIDMMLTYVLKKLTPLLALFAARLLLEALKFYKDLLLDILNCFKFGFGKNLGGDFGWFNNLIRKGGYTDLFGGDIGGSSNTLVGNIDNVNYADIIPTQVEPKQSIC